MLRTRIAVAVVLGAAAAGLAGAQERKFELGFKGPDGKLAPFYQEVSTSVTQVIKVQGQDLTQQQSSKFWYAWTPLKEEQATKDKDTFTRWTVKQKVEGLEMNIDISGNPINYNSTKGEQTGPTSNPGLVEFFKGLKDAEFTATIGKDYQVEKVEGKEEFLKKIGSGSAQMDKLLKTAMTDDVLKEMVDPTAKLFPVPNVVKKKDETWERKSTLDLGAIGKYELTYKFKYVGIEKDKDKIEVETVVNYTAPEAKAAGESGLLFRIKEGSKLTSVTEKDASKGTIIYDPKAKRIESAEIKIKLKGDLIVVIGGTDTKVELTQEQITTIKNQDTSFLAPKGDPKPIDPKPPEPKPGDPKPPEKK